MELEESIAYKKRIENEYMELLAYRDSILRQIEIDSENLTDDNKIRRIVELENTINELLNKPEIQEPQKLDTTEIEAFKKRLEVQYQEILSYREGILKQQKEDEEKLKEIQLKRDDVNNQLAAEIRRAKDNIEELNRENRDFLDNLSEREQEISLKLLRIEEREAELAREVKDFTWTKQDYSAIIKQLSDEKKGLEEESTRIELRKEALNDIMNKEQRRLAEFNKIKEELDAKNKKGKSLLRGLKIKTMKIIQKGEAIAKRDIFLEEKEKSLKNEQGHLYSQQETLKRAFEELKRKGG